MLDSSYLFSLQETRFKAGLKTNPIKTAMISISLFFGSAWGSPVHCCSRFEHSTLTLRTFDLDLWGKMGVHTMSRCPQSNIFHSSPQWAPAYTAAIAMFTRSGRSLRASLWMDDSYNSRLKVGKMESQKIVENGEAVVQFNWEELGYGAHGTLPWVIRRSSIRSEHRVMFEPKSH